VEAFVVTGQYPSHLTLFEGDQDLLSKAVNSCLSHEVLEVPLQHTQGANQASLHRQQVECTTIRVMPVKGRSTAECVKPAPKEKKEPAASARSVFGEGALKWGARFRRCAFYGGNCLPLIL
jgi:hypothetical protein